MFSGSGATGCMVATIFWQIAAYALMGNGDGTFQGAPSLGGELQRNEFGGFERGWTAGPGRAGGHGAEYFSKLLTGANGIPVPGPTSGP